MSTVTSQKHAIRGKRSRLYIILDILRHCDKKSKTRIMYNANLNTKTLTPLLDILTRQGLIKTEYNIYFITERGYEFLQKWHDLCKLLPDIDRDEAELY